MLSHLVGAANRADIRKLHQLEEEKAALEDKLARQQAQLRDGIIARDAKIRELNDALSTRIGQQSRSENGRFVGDRRCCMASLPICAGCSTARCNGARRPRSASTTSCRQTKKPSAAAPRRRKSSRRCAARSRRSRRNSMSADSDEPAEHIDLTGATLLYVGGRPHQVARLKAIVEQAAGRLIHHDGGIEERADLLPGLVSRADAALFPVDCISHRAALMLKRLCHQAGKPYLPLRSIGAAAMFRALRDQKIGRDEKSSRPFPDRLTPRTKKPAGRFCKRGGLSCLTEKKGQEDLDLCAGHNRPDGRAGSPTSSVYSTGQPPRLEQTRNKSDFSTPRPINKIP